MNETVGQWARTKFDTLILIGLLVWLIHANASEYHEVLGAVLLALTGGRNIVQQRADPPNSPAPAEGQKAQ